MIGSILASLGRSSTLVAEAQLPETKVRLRSRTEQAASLGIFGAPTFVVDGELFWGNDRLESALSRARSADRSPEP